MVRNVVRLLAAGMLIASCTSSGRPSPTASAVPTVPATAAPAATLHGWAADLDRIDQFVRKLHPAPFTIHSEAEWVAKLAEIGPQLDGASVDRQYVLVASLIALLDTHSGAYPSGGFHAYKVLFYRFPEGWFVIAAKDRTLIGSRIVSIGGHSVDEVEATLGALVPHDNESGRLDATEGAMSYVEFLHGAAIVEDTVKPQYVLDGPDGSRRTVDFTSTDEGTWGNEFAILGDLIGAAPEAVARRGERVWTRLDAVHRAFLISVNDYGDMTEAAATMKAALDAGTVDRVVLDIRYLRGGNGDFSLLDTLKADPRVNRPGGLTVLIGRENVSAATSIIEDFDRHSNALLVGEATPARADNFRCDCQDLVPTESGITVTVPTHVDNLGDDRPEISPDITMHLGSADFFAGRDPVLDAALVGLTAP